MEMWCEPIRTQGTPFDKRASELLEMLARNEIERDARLLDERFKALGIEFCEDEGCPHFGTKHICVTRSDRVMA